MFFLILVLRVGDSPTREGPGYATDYVHTLHLFHGKASKTCTVIILIINNITLYSLYSSRWGTSTWNHLIELFRSGKGADLGIEMLHAYYLFDTFQKVSTRFSFKGSSLPSVPVFMVLGPYLVFFLKFGLLWALEPTLSNLIVSVVNMPAKI